MTLEELLDELEGVRKHGQYYMARCPAHDDRTQSLQVSEREDGSLGVYCHAECSVDEVMEAIGRAPKDLFPEEAGERIYTYRDEHGKPLYDVVRKPGKEFLQRRYLPDGSLTWGLEDTRRVLYRLPEILAAPADRWIFVCEGEKDVDAFFDRGCFATCNVGGAGKWQDGYAEFLKDRYVSVVRDKDEAGGKHASAVMLSVSKVAKQVRLLEARRGKDAFDHFASGYGKDDFIEPSVFRQMDFTKPVRPPEWLWESFVAKGDLVLAAGVPKLGKSWLTMGLAVAVANGYGSYLNHATEQGRVLYFDEENPGDVVYERIMQRLGHRNLESLRYIWSGGLRLDIHPELLVQEVVLYRPSLIVIDSLARVHSKDENSFSEMSEILNGVLKPLARENGAAVVLIHHHDKQGHGPRGSSDIEAAVDCVINMKGFPGEGAFWMTMKGRRRRSDEGVRVNIMDVPGGGVALRTEG